MITKEQLNSIGFFSKDNTEYYDVPIWDVMFNIKTQTLYEHCEVNGVGDKLCNVTDINNLIELYEKITGNNLPLLDD